MKYRVPSIRTRLAAAVAAGLLLPTLLSRPAAAATALRVGAGENASATGETRQPTVRGLATCDTLTGEWVVRWHITDEYPIAATIDWVTAEPAGTEVHDVPATVPAESTVVTGEHRLPAGVTSGSITVHVTWHDGPEGTVWWPIYIYSWCHRSG